jgi:hypothetical protein
MKALQTGLIHDLKRLTTVASMRLFVQKQQHATTSHPVVLSFEKASGY